MLIKYDNQRKQVLEFLIKEGIIIKGQEDGYSSEKLEYMLKVWASDHRYKVVDKETYIGLVPQETKQYWFSR